MTLETSNRSLSDRLRDTALIEAALQKAVREALWRHKRLGQSVVVFEDGAIKRLAPEDIPDIPDGKG